jgi:ribonuclease BN (tRNA processing enzyme)
MGSLQCEVADLDTYFKAHRIKPNGSFQWCGVKFSLVQTIHVYDGFAVRPSFGLFFSIGDRRMLWTSDTQHAPEQLTDFYDQADLIFHDCETAQHASRVHAHYDQLCRLPETTKAKMWLYHYQDGPLPDAVGDGFRGFVEKGQVFDFDE